MRLLAPLVLVALSAPACSGGGDGPSLSPVDPAAQDAGGAQDAAKPVEEAGAGDEETRSTGAPAAAGGDDPALKAISAFIAEQKVNKELKGWKTRLTKPPQLTFDEGSDYFWVMETTKGTIRIKFMPDVAPMHVSSTIYLTELGFYDDVKFHRVITGFMAQGGDPLGNGSGGPGYKYAGEYDPKVRHNRPGLLSMANTGSEGKGMGPSDGSQFFITFRDTHHLDGKHTIFGEVVEGMAAVKKLEAAGSRGGQTSEPLKIEKATIEVARKSSGD